MQTTRHLIYLLFLLSGLAYSESLPKTKEPEWQLKKDHNNVQLYTRETPNGLYGVKAVTTTTGHLSALILLLKDTSRASDWIADCIEIKVKQANDHKGTLVHSFYNAPWPARNRDMVTYSITTQDPDSLQVKIQISDRGQYIPEKDEFVRMKNVSGLWLITPVSDGVIEISYQGTADPAGNMPTWLANQSVQNAMFNTFTNLSTVITENKYQGKFLTGIKEPSSIP